MSGMPEAPDPARREVSIPAFILRTMLLVVAVLLLFPAALDGLTHGAWPRFVDGLGTIKWIAWGVIFVAMTLLRFAGGPKRR